MNKYKLITYIIVLFSFSFVVYSVDITSDINISGVYTKNNVSINSFVVYDSYIYFNLSNYSLFLNATRNSNVSLYASNYTYFTVYNGSDNTYQCFNTNVCNVSFQDKQYLCAYITNLTYFSVLNNTYGCPIVTEDSTLKDIYIRFSDTTLKIVSGLDNVKGKGGYYEIYVDMIHQGYFTNNEYTISSGSLIRFVQSDKVDIPASSGSGWNLPVTYPTSTFCQFDYQCPINYTCKDNACQHIIFVHIPLNNNNVINKTNFLSFILNQTKANLNYVVDRYDLVKKYNLYLFALLVCCGIFVLFIGILFYKKKVILDGSK
jgi:hypothetical protein